MDYVKKYKKKQVIVESKISPPSANKQCEKSMSRHPNPIPVPSIKQKKKKKSKEKLRPNNKNNKTVQIIPNPLFEPPSPNPHYCRLPVCARVRCSFVRVSEQGREEEVRSSVISTRPTSLQLAKLALENKPVRARGTHAAVP